MSSPDIVFESEDVRRALRSLALHEAVANAIRRDPAVIEQALDNLARWEKSGVSRPWTEEWRVLLQAPRDTLLAFIVERSERADAMRRVSPFAGVLSNAERHRIFKSFSLWRTHDP